MYPTSLPISHLPDTSPNTVTTLALIFTGFHIHILFRTWCFTLTLPVNVPNQLIDLKQHRGAASGIVFHPHNPTLVATVGHDGVVHLTDVRVAQKDGLLKSIRTDAPLTCASFHYEVGCCCRCCCCGV